MGKLEGDFTGKLLKKYRTKRPNAVVLKIADRITLGVPDFAIIDFGYTSWWEAKVLRDRDAWNLRGLGKGIQHTNAMNIAEQGRCFYVVFVDCTNDKSILLVDPRDVNITNPIETVDDHDYVTFVEKMIIHHAPLPGVND
jgi:hypothetical protein